MWAGLVRFVLLFFCKESAACVDINYTKLTFMVLQTAGALAAIVYV